MRYCEYKYLILSDLYRIAGNTKLSTLINHILFEVSFKYVFWMRTCRYTSEHRYFKLFIYPLALQIFRRCIYKYGIDIHFKTEIGSGFYIGHFGGIVVSDLAKIGRNCNISQGVTIGKANRGKRMGYPTVGNNVYIGPGAKIVGAVNIGNNVAIGANCVVTHDIPDNAVVVGIPGRIISYGGAKGYVNKVDYEDKVSC